MAERIEMTLYGFELPDFADVPPEVVPSPSPIPSVEYVETVLMGQTLQDATPVNEIRSYVWQLPTPTRLQEECACQMMAFLVFMFALWCCCHCLRRQPALAVDSTKAVDTKGLKIGEEPDHIHV